MRSFTALAAGSWLTVMKIALLGTGFGQAHAAVYAQRADVDEVVVFGRTPEKLATISAQFGFPASTDLDGLIADGSVDLVDICLPTWLHADVATRAMQAGRDVLIELPLASTLADARRIVQTSRPPAGWRLWTCSPGSAPLTNGCARWWPTSGTAH